MSRDSNSGAMWNVANSSPIPDHFAGRVEKSRVGLGGKVAKFFLILILVPIALLYLLVVIAQSSPDGDAAVKKLVLGIKGEPQAGYSGQHSPAQSATPISWDELIIDIASMNGRKVRVRGNGRFAMQLFAMRRDISDLNEVLVDITSLERSDRLTLLQQCGDILRGCDLIIEGTVDAAEFENKIVAERIEL